jgi:hypothetical protein
MSYVAILDTQLEPDAPLTSQLAFQLRDNPIAIAQGLAGAHRIQGNAHPEFLPGVVVLDSLSIDGADQNISSGLVGSGVGTKYTNYHYFTTIRGGTLRLACDLRVTGTATLAGIAVLVNGVLSSEQTTTSGTYSSKTIDFTYSAGDQVLIRGRVDYTNSGGNAEARNIKIRSDQLGTYRT